MKMNRNKKGQVLPLFIVFLATLVFVFISVYNIGKIVYTRMKVQNATDLASVSTSSWQARGLNLITALNLTITTSYVGTIIAAAFGAYPGTEFPPKFIRLQLHTQRFIQKAFNKYHLGTLTNALVGIMNGADITFPYPLPPNLCVKEMKLSNDRLFSQTQTSQKGGNERTMWTEHSSQYDVSSENLGGIRYEMPNISIDFYLDYKESPKHRSCNNKTPPGITWNLINYRNTIRNWMISKLGDERYADAILSRITLGEFVVPESVWSFSKTIVDQKEKVLIFSSSSSPVTELPIPGKIDVYAAYSLTIKSNCRYYFSYGHWYISDTRTYSYSTKDATYCPRVNCVIDRNGNPTSSCCKSQWLDSIKVNVDTTYKVQSNGKIDTIVNVDTTYFKTCLYDVCAWQCDSLGFYYDLSVVFSFSLFVDAAIELVFGMMRDKKMLGEFYPIDSVESVVTFSVELPKKSTFNQILPPYLTVAKSRIFYEDPESEEVPTFLFKPSWRATLMPVGEVDLNRVIQRYTSIDIHQVIDNVNQKMKQKGYGLSEEQEEKVNNYIDAILNLKIRYH